MRTSCKISRTHENINSFTHSPFTTTIFLNLLNAVKKYFNAAKNGHNTDWAQTIHNWPFSFDISDSEQKQGVAGDTMLQHRVIDNICSKLSSAPAGELKNIFNDLCKMLTFIQYILLYKLCNEWLSLRQFRLFPTQ